MEMQTIYLSAAKQTPLRTSDTMHGFWITTNLC